MLVAVILFSQKYHLNPDNLATPLAASIGDVVSISLLSFIASLLYENISECSIHLSAPPSTSTQHDYRRLCRDPSLDHFHCGYLLPGAAAHVGCHRAEERVHAAGAKERLGSSALSALHQRVRSNFQSKNSKFPIIVQVAGA